MTATVKRWIIEKDHRRCAKYDCAGSTQERSARVTLDRTTGTITRSCTVCGETDSGKARSYKLWAPCTTCGYVRDVTVRVYNGGQEQSNRACSACELEASANRHLATARDFLRRVKEIRAKRTASARSP